MQEVFAEKNLVMVVVDALHTYPKQTPTYKVLSIMAVVRGEFDIRFVTSRPIGMRLLPVI